MPLVATCCAGTPCRWQSVQRAHLLFQLAGALVAVIAIVRAGPHLVLIARGCSAEGSRSVRAVPFVLVRLLKFWM